MNLPKLNLEWKKIKEKPAMKKEEKKQEEKEAKHSFFISIFLPFIKIIIIYGLLINYAAFIIFNTKFNFYSWPAYGIAYYFISEELTSFIRSIIPRK